MDMCCEVCGARLLSVNGGDWYECEEGCDDEEIDNGVSEISNVFDVVYWDVDGVWER